MSRLAQIDVTNLKDDTYEVVVDNFTSSRSFVVTLKEETYAKLSRGRTKDDFIRDSFRFLLTHEPMESILEKFDISQIGNYFPEYEQTI